MTTARAIAERVVRPVITTDSMLPNDQLAVGLFVGEESKFVIPVSFVFGQGSSRGQEHLLEELRKVVECAVLQADTQRMVNEMQRSAGEPLDAVGLTPDSNDYYRGKIKR